MLVQEDEKADPHKIAALPKMNGGAVFSFTPVFTTRLYTESLPHYDLDTTPDAGLQLIISSWPESGKVL